MTLSTQFITMLAMVGMGSFFGVALDTYNRFLKRDTQKHWLVFLNDILFWLLQGLTIFYVLFIVNEGDLRFYIFIALFCGFAAYQSLMKQVYLKCLEMAITIIISIWRFFVKLVQILIYRPLLALFGFLISIMMAAVRGLLLFLKFIGKTLVWIVKVLFRPIVIILLLFWKLLPKKIKKIVEKLYNIMAGFLRKIKKYLSSMIERWKKQK
ncbi:MAG: spore cortex biosynthesis protein YabQ [Bacillus sp. (in: firmicutes)]|jgi:spore cortex biosynthesis protein YabQ|nr:spore cortex biosynthesis protein YabQ [Bacillus sp. (in: firmicutes)]